MKKKESQGGTGMRRVNPLVKTLGSFKGIRTIRGWLNTHRISAEKNLKLGEGRSQKEDRFYNSLEKEETALAPHKGGEPEGVSGTPTISKKKMETSLLERERKKERTA